MAAATTNQLMQARNPSRRQPGPVATGVRLYQNTLCFNNATGYIVDITAAGVNTFAGIVIEEEDNTFAGNANGTRTVERWLEGVFVLNGTGFTQATVGQVINAIDNNTVTTAAGSKVGRCVGYVSTTQIEVEIDTQQA